MNHPMVGDAQGAKTANELSNILSGKAQTSINRLSQLVDRVESMAIRLGGSWPQEADETASVIDNVVKRDSSHDTNADGILYRIERIEGLLTRCEEFA